MSTVLITGAATGIGNLTARAAARAGHRVYATMRDPEGRNAPRAGELRDAAAAEGVDLRVIELDVSSQESADAAVRTVLADGGGLDVVVHNAGHLLVGYVEAFTAEEIAHLVDVNTLGVQRLNRAALPTCASAATAPCSTSAAPSPSPPRPSSAPMSSPRPRWTRWPWSPPTRSPSSASRP